MRKANTQPLWRFFFLLYCAVMLWLLFGRSYGWIDGLTYREMLEQNINLTPLLTIRNYLYVLIHRTNEALMLHCFVNLAGNVLLFIPAGWLLPRIFRKMRHFFRFFVTCFLCILLVETAQLLSLLGSFDVDDLILNLLGMLIGFLLFQICGRKKAGN